MIQFADKNTAPFVRQMWKICFEDTDEYMNLFFSRQYKHENTLIWLEEGTVAASLQMTAYMVTIGNKKVPFYYLVGLCTLPEYRNNGYMSKLIQRSFEVMKERQISLTILVPAEDWLFDYYSKFGFERCSENGTKPLPSIKNMLDSTSTLEDAYAIFDKQFNQNNFQVQKTLYDFTTIVEDLKLDGFPDKFNLAAMACIIDDKSLDKDIFRKNPITINLMLE